MGSRGLNLKRRTALLILILILAVSAYMGAGLLTCRLWADILQDYGACEIVRP